MTPNKDRRRMHAARIAQVDTSISLIGRESLVEGPRPRRTRAAPKSMNMIAPIGAIGILPLLKVARMGMPRYQPRRASRPRAAARQPREARAIRERFILKVWA